MSDIGEAPVMRLGPDGALALPLRHWGEHGGRSVKLGRALQDSACPSTTCSSEGQACMLDTSLGVSLGTCVVTAASSADNDGSMIPTDGSNLPSTGFGPDYTPGNATRNSTSPSRRNTTWFNQTFTNRSTTTSSTVNDTALVATTPPVPPNFATVTTTNANNGRRRQRRGLANGECLTCKESNNDGCYDLPDWVDNEGDPCSSYVSCTENYHQTLSSASFEQYAVDDVSALDACCACGGGSTSNFENNSHGGGLSATAVLYAVVFSVLMVFGALCAAAAVWVRICRNRREQRRAQATQAPPGLTSEQLSQFPTHRCTTASSPSAAKYANATCSICICEYEPGDTLMDLPCGHAFHSLCVSKWLRTSTKCPMCKFDVKQALEKGVQLTQESFPREQGEQGNTEAGADVRVEVDVDMSCPRTDTDDCDDAGGAGGGGGCKGLTDAIQSRMEEEQQQQQQQQQQQSEPHSARYASTPRKDTAISGEAAVELEMVALAPTPVVLDNKTLSAKPPEGTVAVESDDAAGLDMLRAADTGPDADADTQMDRSDRANEGDVESSASPRRPIPVAELSDSSAVGPLPPADAAAISTSGSQGKGPHVTVEVSEGESDEGWLSTTTGSEVEVENESEFVGRMGGAPPKPVRRKRMKRRTRRLNAKPVTDGTSACPSAAANSPRMLLRGEQHVLLGVAPSDMSSTSIDSCVETDGAATDSVVCEEAPSADEMQMRCR